MRFRRDPLALIETLDDLQARGYQFETLLCDILVEAGFEVQKNPDGTRPRQSDIFATDDEKSFLIEAKWLSRDLGSREVDDIRIRLQDCPVSVIGCIFSMSEFNDSGIKRAESHRQQPILLFSPSEVRTFISQPDQLRRLFKRKLHSLASDGCVWFMGEESKAKLPHAILPASPFSILLENSERMSVASRNVSNEDIMFAQRVPDIRWNRLNGNGVGLNISIEIQTLAEFRSFAAYLNSQLGLTSEGTFAIRQMERSWHGHGIENLLLEAARWESRYSEHKMEYVHHSEDLHYFDACDYGLLMLSARQRIGDTGRLHDCSLEIHLFGVPLDARPLMRICERAGEPKPFFTPFNQSRLDELWLKQRIFVEPIAQIISKRDPRFICGLVVKNPFLRKKILKGVRSDSPINYLSSSEFLFCTLSDWHERDDPADKYYLKKVECLEIDTGFVFHCSATWNQTSKVGPAGPSIIESMLKEGKLIYTPLGNSKTKKIRSKRSRM